MRRYYIPIAACALAIGACEKNANTAVNEASPPEVDHLDQSKADLCVGSGPQNPRDIAQTAGANPIQFALAPASDQMNLCNIHTHTNAEHKGPGFSIYAGDGHHGGYQYNETGDLTKAELAAPAAEPGAFEGVMPGDTIEVHWAFTSCDITPGEGLESCFSDTCSDPVLRVEAQTFLVVNDPNALDFNDFVYAGTIVNDRHQPRALPIGTGAAVIFRGSTTGSSYTQSVCSPHQVTWSVRPSCAKLDINSLNDWARNGNVFNEAESHAVRQLVTALELLSPIE